MDILLHDRGASSSARVFDPQSATASRSETRDMHYRESRSLACIRTSKARVPWNNNWLAVAGSVCAMLLRSTCGLGENADESPKIVQGRIATTDRMLKRGFVSYLESRESSLLATHLSTFCPKWPRGAPPCNQCQALTCEIEGPTYDLFPQAADYW